MDTCRAQPDERFTEILNQFFRAFLAFHIKLLNHFAGFFEKSHVLRYNDERIQSNKALFPQTHVCIVFTPKNIHRNTQLEPINLLQHIYADGVTRVQGCTALHANELFTLARQKKRYNAHISPKVPIIYSNREREKKRENPGNSLHGI